MEKNYFLKKVLQACVLFFLIITANVFSQVGIGTVAPETSSMLDVSSTTKGMLTPRMTTAQRLAIVAPVDGLMVYDVDLKAFHYYNSSTLVWTVVNSASTGRLKFKRIRSGDALATVLASELAAGGGNKYILESTTHYEINGIVTFDKSIDLNNASLIGIDTNEDKLFKTSGFLFEGATGGVVKNLTIAGGSSVFNLIGSDNTQGLIFRDCIVSGSANVGTISSFALVFFSIVNYLGNTTGITYTNCTRVLLSNTAWFGNNLGTFEKFIGTFSLIQKQGGFCEVNGAAIGVDVSASPVISGDAVMETVVFTGALSTGGKYVNGYTLGTYSGYNFNNKWNIRCAGIPTEGDSFAVGDVGFSLGIGSGITTSLTTGADVKILGTTTSNNFFRASTGSMDNRIVYVGTKRRFFTFSSTVSFVGTDGSNTTYILFFKKNGNTVINSSKSYVFSTNTTDVRSNPIQGIIEMIPGDYIEVFINRNSGTSNMSVISLNLFMR